MMGLGDGPDLTRVQPAVVVMFSSRRIAYRILPELDSRSWKLLVSGTRIRSFRQDLFQ